MEQYYLVLLAFLGVIAVIDLFVGVSNDAVNFLNSALGCRISSFRTTLWVASIGVLAGATFSSGMMEIARSGVFHPQLFTFSELMIVFFAVMVADVILLDAFNSLGLPTSTTVSIVFELMGAAFAAALFKLIDAGAPLSDVADYINSSKSLGIVSGILISVVVAFISGAVVQYLARLVFTFKFEKAYRRIGAIYGGIALTAIIYFLVMKGAKGASFMRPEWIQWINANTAVILFSLFTGLTVLFQVLITVFRVNIFKIIILAGTFSLAFAFAGNDHRLGANEAPPAVLSVFLGDELAAVLDAIENDRPYNGTKKKLLKLGVDVLPLFVKDTTDRNRTSPFAFTGNKFEFRMLGSANSIACANIMLNSAVAESLKIYADRLEKAEDFSSALHEMIKKTIKDHKKIIFNGNGYDEAWIKEATEKRGLLNYRTTPDCMPHLLDEKNVEMLTSHGVYSESELKSRCEIMLENYNKAVLIEASTMVSMAAKEIIPAIEKYASAVADSALKKKSLLPELECAAEKDTVKTLSCLADRSLEGVKDLKDALAALSSCPSTEETSYAIRDAILPAMSRLRAVADEAETKTAKEYWPFPTYGDLLFSVK